MSGITPVGDVEVDVPAASGRHVDLDIDVEGWPFTSYPSDLSFGVTHYELPTLVAAAEPDLDAGGYRLTGTKAWITHGGVADMYTVMARTSEDRTGGVSCFVVPADSTGLSAAAGAHHGPEQRVVHVATAVVPHCSPNLVGDGIESCYRIWPYHGVLCKVIFTA